MRACWSFGCSRVLPSWQSRSISHARRSDGLPRKRSSCLSLSCSQLASHHVAPRGHFAHGTGRHVLCPERLGRHLSGLHGSGDWIPTAPTWMLARSALPERRQQLGIFADCQSNSRHDLPLRQMRRACSCVLEDELVQLACGLLRPWEPRSFGECSFLGRLVAGVFFPQPLILGYTLDFCYVEALELVSGTYGHRALQRVGQQGDVCELVGPDGNNIEVLSVVA